ncbi:uncharacterized protein LOC114523845 isoform X2 [Dendronephthya gigantea]|uniref:uncharacterized protein LOC114523845 isoform X2 n=1 Tax=Dendronephthya gigantea TaxID=151771 RepID=UPI00106B2A83|nr:uncharacterized protein LOC114523845 isoform X2 [Dendronephthya gigantea]
MIFQPAVTSCLRYLVIIVCLAWAVKAELTKPGNDGRKLSPISTNARSVIPDQSELDEVDEDALERGHEQFIVDKDDETLTEVIQDDKVPDTIPFVTVTVPPVDNTKSGRNSSQLESSKNTSSQITQSLPTGNRTSLMPSHFGDTNGTRYDNNKNSLNQDNSNVNSTLSNNPLVNKNHSTRENKTVQDSNKKKICSKLKKRKHGKKEQINLNGTVNNVITANYSTMVVKVSNNITQFSVGRNAVAQNISEMKNPENKSANNADAIYTSSIAQIKTEQGRKNNIAGQMAGTKTSDAGKDGGLFYANATNGLRSSNNNTSVMNNSLPVLDGTASETKPNATVGLDKKPNAIIVSRQNAMQNTSLNNRNSSQILPSTNVRRANINRKISTQSTSQRSSKPSQKLRSFLTAVKEMFNKPETAHDILSWEAWGPCSRTCGVGAFRTRQRKCEGLVARDFDVACPEPRRQNQKCPVVPCSSKSHQKTSKQFAKTKQVKTNHQQRTNTNNDKGNVEEIFGKHKDSPRIGTEEDVNQVTGDEALAESDESSTEDDDDRPEGYDETSEYTSNGASVQTASQKRYLYTVWGAWSECTRTCGQRAYAFRKRYCINAVTGEIKRHCQRPTILAKKCALTPCPVDGGLSDWSKWSTCSGKCGIMERHRSCTRPKPAYGGRECFKLPVQMRLCGTCTEDKVTAVKNLASYSPKVLCGFDPCQRVGCLEDKGAICVTDFDCNPNFFNDEGHVLKACRDSNQLFLRPLAQKKCSFNPCSFAKCDVDGVKCLVDTKCRPFFVNGLGKRVTCRGSNVLRISSDLICGFNPCKITTCTVDPEAKCITDYRCNPIFINKAGQRISGCTEDEVEAAESLSTGTPSAAPQSTENPSARDTTPLQKLNHRHEPHKAQKYRYEASVKKTIESNIDEAKKKLDDITKLETILARRLNDSSVSYGNSTNSVEELPGELSASSELHAKENALDIKFLESVLQSRLDPNGTLYSENTTSTGENLQEMRNDSSDNEHEHNKENNIAAFNLGSGDETTPDNTLTLKTVHENNSETTEIVDSPSTESESLNTDVLDQPVTYTDKVSVDTREKPLEVKTSPDIAMEADSNSKLGLGTEEKDKETISQRKKERQLADVDRYILDELYRKKMMEDAGTKPLGSSGGARPEGKTDLVANETTGLASEYNTKNQASSDNMVNTDYNTDSYARNSGNNNDLSNVSNVNNNIGLIANNSSDSNNNNNSYNNNDAAVNSNISVHGNDNNFENNAVVPKQANDTLPSIVSVNNHIQSTTTTPAAAAATNNNNNNINSNNNDLPSVELNKNSNNSFNIYKNSNPNHNNENYPLNTKIKPEHLITPPAIEHKIFKSNPSQNTTLHYNLLPAKMRFIKKLNKAAPLGTKETTQDNSHLSKILSDKKHSKTEKDVSLDTLWDNYLADNELLHGGAVLFDAAGKITNGKTTFEHSKSDGYHSSTHLEKPGKVKLVNGGSITPGHKVVNTLLHTSKPGRQDEHIPVLHSSDPDLVISPYDEDVASNALAKEQDENPEGIPSNAELNKILDSAYATKLIDGNHGSSTLPQKTQNQPADYAVPQQLSSAQPDKPFNTLSSKPDNRVTDGAAQNNFMNKLILKAVQKEISKLKIDGILKDALFNTKPSQEKQSDKATSPEKQRKQEHKIGVAENAAGYLGYNKDNPGHVGSTETPYLSSQKQGRHDTWISKNLRVNHVENGAFAKQERQDKTGHLGINKRPNGIFVLKAKPYKAKDFEGTMEDNNQVYPPKSKAIPTTVPIFQEENGGDIMATYQPGGATENSNSDEEENDRETMRELDDYLENDDLEKTTAKPEYTTNTPEESDVGSQWKDEDYSSPTGQERIDGVNNGHGREPEYKESYSPSLLNEIKELGLHEYYIKDGFQTPKHKGIDNAQVRQIVKSHHRRVNEYGDNQYDRHRYRPLRYGKKFHLAQVKMIPGENTHGAFRQHNSGGDEIERVPSSYREEDVVARSHTSPKYPKKGKSPVRTLSNFFNKLRNYYEQAHTGEIANVLKNDHQNADLENAVILTAKDDGDQRNYAQDSTNSIVDPKKRRFSHGDNLMENNVLFDENNISNGRDSDLMVFRATDENDRDYRRNLGIR